MSRHKTIDVHAHILPEETIGLLQKTAPSLALRIRPLDERSGILEIAGITQNPFPREAWDLEWRFRDMDQSQVDIQLLSNTPQTFLYDEEASLGAELFPGYAEAVAQMCRPGSVFQPEPARQEAYAAIYTRLYQKLYPALGSVFAEYGRIFDKA